jgi:nicotinamide mononucleotide (NMN) deamidase PncC
MSAADQVRLVEQIHASGRQLVVAVTGGGSGAISALLQVPGASASVLEAIVPYAATAMQQWVGGGIEKYCSERTARAMAMRAFERARELSDGDLSALVGIGATASLASSRPKRGTHRVHVAWQTVAATTVATSVLAKVEGARAAEEEVSARLVVHAVAEACDISVPPVNEPIISQFDKRSQIADAGWSELLFGESRAARVRPLADDAQPLLLFPGAFNPLHWGHDRMAEIAAARYGRPVTYELSVINVDKPPLDYIEIADRLAELADQPVLLTRAATFVEKAALAPGAVFIVGADTLERIADPRYYGGDQARRDTAIKSIAKHGCRFLVFGRMTGRGFTTSSAVDIPPALQKLCEEVPEVEFRADVSSTELRADTMGGHAFTRDEE